MLMLEVGDIVKIKPLHLMAEYWYLPGYVQNFIKDNQKEKFIIGERQRVSRARYANHLLKVGSDWIDNIWFYDYMLELVEKTDGDDQYVSMLFE